jgi:NTE family protein
MKADAIFEGGGMRGIGTIGALACMDNKGYEWVRVAGTSVGAVIAALIAAGYTNHEMKNLLSHLDFKQFLDKDNIQRFPLVGKALGVIIEKGLYSGDAIEKWIGDLLKAKGIMNFGDLTTNGECILKIIASDITKRRILVLPDDLLKYGINPTKFKIARAVRMSISIPFYFKPVKFIHRDGISYIVDGSISSNYPITIFDTAGIPERPVIGFKFDCPDVSHTACGKTDVLSFLFDIADTLSATKNKEWLKDENLKRSILIDTAGVDVTEFNISKKKGLALFKAGYKGAEKFLETWDYEKYKENFIKKSEAV